MARAEGWAAAGGADRAVVCFFLKKLMMSSSIRICSDAEGEALNSEPLAEVAEKRQQNLACTASNHRRPPRCRTRTE